MEIDHSQEGIGESLRSVRNLGLYRVPVHTVV